MFARSLIGFVLVLTARSTFAQFNQVWVEFDPTIGRIRAGDGSVLTEVTQDPEEKDFAWGDLDRDGAIDLVLVRKQPFSTIGARRNYLLRNEGGFLVDRTGQYASASDVLGDQGFLTPTNDRDVVIVDVDQDGWLDLVTATTFSDGQPKHISHPRVYRNLGNDANGNWLGLRFENFRIPTMVPAPRFNEVAAGDLTGDGAPDLYFGDQGDLTDRLLVNDGHGVFRDSGTNRMPLVMLDAADSLAIAIADLNGDGALDVVRDTGNSGSWGLTSKITAAYNSAANPGIFSGALYQTSLGNSAPYHVAVGDLNQDDRPDIVYVDDFADGVRYNLATGPSGLVRWGPASPYQFLTEGDDGFGGNIVIADLDGDGWNDTLHADVDNDVYGFTRRAHVYHNPGGTPGQEILLREEAEMAVGGWRGAKPFLPADLSGTFDIAVFDLDGDGDLDIVLGRSSGTFVWLNKRF